MFIKTKGHMKTMLKVSHSDEPTEDYTLAEPGHIVVVHIAEKEVSI